MASVSISAAGLSVRRRAIRGKRSAKPDSWRLDRMITSNATSTTIVGSTARKRPCWRMVCASNHAVISAISASVSPLYALPMVTSRPVASSRTANV